MNAARAQTRRVLAVVAGVVAIAGLASCGHSNLHTITGPVSITSPNLCIGRSAAKGMCLSTGSVDVSSARVGECVKATYKTPGTQGADGELTKLQSTTGC